MTEDTQQEDWALKAARQFAESAEGQGLKVPIEAVASVFRQLETVDVDMAGLEPVYSTEEAAQFFSKSTQWLYWGLKPRDQGGGGLFCYPDGRPIEYKKLGKRDIKRFSLSNIKDMGVSLYQNGTIRMPELKEIIRKIQLARSGKWAPKTTGKAARIKRRGR